MLQFLIIIRHSFILVTIFSFLHIFPFLLIDLSPIVLSFCTHYLVLSVQSFLLFLLILFNLMLFFFIAAQIVQVGGPSE